MNSNFIAPFKRFYQIKRGYYSLIILCFLLLISLFLEFFINNRALIISYNNSISFPVLSGYISGKQFGLDYDYETNYLELKKEWESENSKNWILMPFVPYSPYSTNISFADTPPPHAPSIHNQHYLGTDKNGRDILARIAYAFRIAIFFSFSLYVFITLIGVSLGCMMGYFGGKFDLIFQRIVEIWSTLPLIYIIIILSAVTAPGIISLLIIFILFSWTGITWLMRAEIFREKNRTYCEVARSLGASHFQIIFKHLLPNSLTPIIAGFPFQMVSGIGLLTSLDYLGYGLSPSEPSWGDLLKQGQETFTFAPWIITAPSVAIIVILVLFTFIGEAVREAFDPKINILYS